MSEKRSPEHLHFFKPGMRWDWRRENAVEVILVVFVLLFFFTLPRAGCGITGTASASAEPAAEVQAPGVTP